ncbi:MAG: PIG-L family deacetylase [Chlorogloeopsis fritschii C42_A2020_084]|jgi:N-acetylglucosamine malate deacetylase 1|uniref:PIG-L deacetylase family protein n=1 Tax=Chlorogloeopsis fritschii TaxID=1124 RepID=UPI0019DF3695|nr:PIG-L deacetylase family protein [Chlorogloeopsis fritschii]MBF2004333.1 PIG-L family deacetylase [Chlorogloeopsis fritschii C42_A2020_084]
MNNKILVIAPHADDEVLGVGGTIARFAAEGAEVYVVIMTKGCPPDYSEEINQIACQEALAAHQVLGVKETIFLSFPAARLDTVPHRDVNRQLFELIKKFQPDTLFIPFYGDIHMDHQRVFLSSLVAARPNNPYAPKTIYAYETLSETNWHAPYLTINFVPNVFVDISPYLETKLEAMQMYASQIKPFPDERSEETLRALATLRGSTVNHFAAEAFYLVRQVV